MSPDSTHLLLLKTLLDFSLSLDFSLPAKQRD